MFARTVLAMPRPPRPQFAGAIYHVTTRGVERGPIFRGLGDRAVFLDVLAATVERFEWRCHAYCLMGNHYHLLVETPEPNVAAGMERLNGVYARALNRRHSRRGHVFEARYGAKLIERDAHAAGAGRYIVLNPVRAAICASAGDWPWSSFAATAGHVPTPAWLTVDWLLAQFHTDPETARARYAEFVAEGAAHIRAERRAHERAARLMPTPVMSG